MKLSHSHGAKLEGLFEILDIGETSNHLAKPDEEGLQALVYLYVALLFEYLSLPELFLVLNPLRREPSIASFLEILDVDVILLLPIDLPHALPPLNQVVYKQHCILKIYLVQLLILLLFLQLRRT